MLPTTTCDRFVRHLCDNPPALPQVQPQIQQFVAYFRSTWLPTVNMWSQWNNDGPRTTNHAEGWHNRLSTWFDNVEHPSLGEWLTKMKSDNLIFANEAEMMRLHYFYKRFDNIYAVKILIDLGSDNQLFDDRHPERQKWQ